MQPNIKRRKTYLIAAVLLTLIGLVVAISNVPPDASSRAQVSVGLNVAAEAKATITEYYRDYEQFPADNEAAGLPPATNIQEKYVSGVQVDAGDIVVTFGNDANSDIQGTTLILRPKRSGKSVIWVCFSVDITPRNLPQACRQENDDKL